MVELISVPLEVDLIVKLVVDNELLLFRNCFNVLKVVVNVIFDLWKHVHPRELVVVWETMD
jgi:hypothetical protein